MLSSWRLAAGGGTHTDRLKRLLRLLGPGLVTGASDDDPSGIGTYAVAGASLGYATLWTALVTFPLMAAVQFACAKVGVVTHCGLAGVARRHYARPFLYAVVAGLLIANTINVGADIGAVAAAINLLVPIPIVWMIVPITLGLLALQIWGAYRAIERVFKWLTLALFGYLGAAAFAHPNGMAVLRATFVPHIRLDSSYLATLVALLGTTISPYLFFWQASQEVEEETVREEDGQAPTKDTREELREAAWDVDIGMLLSNVVMYAIILATAATLYAAGRRDIQTAADAAAALRPIAGNAASLLLALGLIGSGLLAIPVLAGSSAYAISETFGWPCSLDRKPGEAKGFYAAIAGSMLVGMLVNFFGFSPIRLLFWTAVINGFLAPPLLVLLMLVANDRRILGSCVNGPLANALGWAATVAMTAAAAGLVWTWVR